MPNTGNGATALALVSVHHAQDCGTLTDFAMSSSARAWKAHRPLSMLDPAAPLTRRNRLGSVEAPEGGPQEARARHGPPAALHLDPRVT